jgi:predicted PurR-regulated permease PerM
VKNTRAISFLTNIANFSDVGATLRAAPIFFASLCMQQSKIRQNSYLLLLVVFGLFIASQLLGFLSGFLGALTLYFFLRKPQAHLERRYNFTKLKSTLLLLISSFVLIVIPAGLILGMVTARIADVVSHSEEVLQSINVFITAQEHRFGFEILTPENLKQATAWITTAATSMVGVVASSFATVAVMYFVLYFMLLNRRSLEAWFYEYLPLEDNHIALIGKELNSLVVSNAAGIPATAFVQALLALICYAILGVDDLLFWFCATAIAAIIPLVGASIAYVPLAVMQYTSHHETNAWVILIFGLLVLGTVDNLVRLYIQNKWGDAHPLITIFGVIIGVNIFGFMGLVFGPILISLFILLVKIYMREFHVGGMTLPKELDVAKESHVDL